MLLHKICQFSENLGKTLMLSGICAQGLHPGTAKLLSFLSLLYREKGKVVFLPCSSDTVDMTVSFDHLKYLVASLKECKKHLHPLNYYLSSCIAALLKHLTCCGPPSYSAYTGNNPGKAMCFGLAKICLGEHLSVSITFQCYPPSPLVPPSLHTHHFSLVHNNVHFFDHVPFSLCLFQHTTSLLCLLFLMKLPSIRDMGSADGYFQQ